MDYIVLSLGSNIGDRHANLDLACSLLEKNCVQISRKSSIYESEPVGFTDQDKFLNQVLIVDTEYSPGKLLNICLEVESEMGRIRMMKNGPRIIDIDLLFYRNEMMTEGSLLLPHPRIADRRFILIPLLELIPEQIHPVIDQSIPSILDTCVDHHMVERLDNQSFDDFTDAFTKEIFDNWIRSFGENPDREGLNDTYRRFSDSRKEIFSGYETDPVSLITLFDAENYDEMIICRDIDFFSTCEHHLLPFYGRAHIGYIPDESIIGLSKFSRVVDVFARRMQNQERLTTQIADLLWEELSPKGMGIILEAEHLCIKSRGADKQNSEVTTSSFKGLFKKNPETRAEFLHLIRKH